MSHSYQGLRQTCSQPRSGNFTMSSFRKIWGIVRRLHKGYLRSCWGWYERIVRIPRNDREGSLSPEPLQRFTEKQSKIIKAAQSMNWLLTIGDLYNKTNYEERYIFSIVHIDVYLYKSCGKRHFYLSWHFYNIPR